MLTGLDEGRSGAMVERATGAEGAPGEGPVHYRVLGLEELDGAVAEHFRRRRRRRLLTFVTLPALVLATATVATAYGTGLLGHEPAPVCTAVSVPAPVRERVEVTVLNSNDTPGLGRAVGGTLAERGFEVASVGNADDSVYVKDVGIIYHGDEGEDAALLLQKQVPGIKLWNDHRPGRGVQLVLGYAFDGLVDEAPPPPPAPSEITVNVYNTTYREGLAQVVAGELRRREFHIAAVGNDPRGTFSESDVAVVRHGPAGASAATRLAEQLGGARLEDDGRASAIVDLVLMTRFEGLRPVTEVPQVQPYVRPAETIERPCQPG